MESDEEGDGKRLAKGGDGGDGTTGETPSMVLPLFVTHSTSVFYVYTSGDTNSCTANVPRDVKHVFIRDGVTHIDANAFIDCSLLSYINFSEESTVTSIGAGAFCGCPGLTSIRLPKGPVSFFSRAFYDCPNLVYVTVGKRLRSIGMKTFTCCGSLLTFSVLDRDFATASSCHDHHYHNLRKETTFP